MSGRLRYADRPALMPIINANRQIIAWSRDVPVYLGGQLRHYEAERLIGDFRVCYVEVWDAELAKRAGAPSEWEGSWRCLAVCSVRAVHQQDGDVPLFRFPESEQSTN